MVERAAATFGIIHNPITTALITSDLLHTETDPDRLAELEAVQARVKVRLVITLIFTAIVIVAALIMSQQQRVQFSSAEHRLDQRIRPTDFSR